MDDRWVRILQFMETFLDLFTVLLTAFSLVFVWKGYRLAEKFLSQHLEKVQLEEFFKNRRELYFELEKLLEIFHRITFPRIKQSETNLEVESFIDLEWHIMGPDSLMSFNAFKNEHRVEVFYRRIANEFNNLLNSKEKIRSILIFLEDLEMLEIYNLLESKVDNLLSFNSHFYEDKVLTELVKGQSYERGSVRFIHPEIFENRVNLLESYIGNLYSDNYNENPSYNQLKEISLSLQKLILSYPKKLISNRK